jgi:hypothetical protein
MSHPTWYGPGQQSPVEYLNGSGVPEHSIWVGVAVGHCIRTGVHLDIDQQGLAGGELVLDAANARKLIEQLTSAVEVLEKVTA